MPNAIELRDRYEQIVQRSSHERQSSRSATDAQVVALLDTIERELEVASGQEERNLQQLQADVLDGEDERHALGDELRDLIAVPTNDDGTIRTNEDVKREGMERDAERKDG